MDLRVWMLWGSHNGILRSGACEKVISSSHSIRCCFKLVVFAMKSYKLFMGVKAPECTLTFKIWWIWAKIGLNIIIFKYFFQHLFQMWAKVSDSTWFWYWYWYYQFVLACSSFFQSFTAWNIESDFILIVYKAD
jgi:hypothetical protein